MKKKKNNTEGYMLAAWISALFVFVAGLFLFI